MGKTIILLIIEELRMFVCKCFGIRYIKGVKYIKKV